MRVLALRHVPFEGAGRIEPVLAARGIELQYADLYRDGAPAPDHLDAADALIVLGGPMSANDDLPYLRQEMALIEKAMHRDIPTLCVCLGAQLLARTLGAKVYRNRVKEIGWYDIEVVESGADDPVFQGLSRETVFHWHSETFDLPAGAVWLAQSEASRHQAYRVGSRVYAFQFHLEVTPEMIADWSTQDENCGDVRELDGPIDPGFNAVRIDEVADTVFGRWCDLAQGG